jgi:hypothetical protein
MNHMIFYQRWRRILIRAFGTVPVPFRCDNCGRVWYGSVVRIRDGHEGKKNFRKKRNCTYNETRSIKHTVKGETFAFFFI